MEEIFIDVMSSSGRFICQVPFRYCKAFPISYNEAQEAVYAKRPSLRNRNIIFTFSNQKA